MGNVLLHAFAPSQPGVDQKVQRFRKARTGATGNYYEAEVAGLQWIDVGDGPPIPTVYSVAPDGIDLEFIETVVPSLVAARAFGRQLAILHAAGAPAFGAGPPEAADSGWIADLPMAYGEFDSFGPMYARLRVRPYLEIAGETNVFSGDELAVFDRLCDALTSNNAALSAGGQQVARLHGDLWSGNLLWSPDRAGKPAIWLIDPATYGGHGESDLAMLALFGAPHIDEIIAGYQDMNPLAPGWKQRVSLHQVYPLLVHAILFGGSYARQAVAAANQAMRLVD